MLLQITSLKDKASAKENKIREYGSRLEAPGMTGLTVATLYLFNPYTIVSCIGRSTILFSNMAAIAGIWMGMKGIIAISKSCIQSQKSKHRITNTEMDTLRLSISIGDRALALFSIAVASYLSLYPVMLAIPVMIMLTDSIQDVEAKKVIEQTCYADMIPYHGHHVDLTVVAFLGY